MIFSEESHDCSLEGLTNGNNNQNLYETVGSTFMQTGVCTRTRETNQELNQSESTDYTPCRVDEDCVEGMMEKNISKYVYKYKSQMSPDQNIKTSSKLIRKEQIIKISEPCPVLLKLPLPEKCKAHESEYPTPESVKSSICVDQSEIFDLEENLFTPQNNTSQNRIEFVEIESFCTTRGIISESNYSNEYKTIKGNSMRSNYNSNNIIETKNLGRKSPTELRKNLKMWNKENLFSYKKLKYNISVENSSNKPTLTNRIESLKILKPNSSYKLRLANSQYLSKTLK